MSRYFSTDPSINLNFSVFLYNTGEKKEAAKQFSIYEKKMETYRSVKGNEIDQEVGLYLVHGSTKSILTVTTLSSMKIS